MYAKWIQKVDEMGELKVVEGADWSLEIGALSVLASKHKEKTPALLFDCTKGYPRGWRILVGFFESLRRSALTTNLPIDISREGFIQACRERLATSPSIPPVTTAIMPAALLERSAGSHYSENRKGFSSRMIIDACRPSEWMKDFPPAAGIDPDFQKVLMEKWKKELFS
jgi:3-polyprenyl-4-hydroxybenzoate decarboxylase